MAAPETTRLLLVDDDALVLDAAAQALRRYTPYDLESFTSGLAAIDRARAQRFDLAILDMHMPEMSGVALARELREHQPTLPIVFLTGTPDAAPRRELEAVGPRTILAKPIAPAALADAVRRIVEGPTPA